MKVNEEHLYMSLTVFVTKNLKGKIKNEPKRNVKPEKES